MSLNGEAKYGRVFVTDKPFQTSLVFVVSLGTKVIKRSMAVIYEFF